MNQPISKPPVSKKVKNKIVKAPKSSLITQLIAPFNNINVNHTQAHMPSVNEEKRVDVKSNEIKEELKKEPKEELKIDVKNLNNVSLLSPTLSKASPVSNPWPPKGPKKLPQKTAKNKNINKNHIKQTNSIKGSQRQKARQSKEFLGSIEPYVNPVSHNHNENTKSKNFNKSKNVKSGKSSSPHARQWVSNVPKPNPEFIASNTFQLYTDGSHMMEYNKAGIGGYLLSPQGKVVMEFSETIKDDTMLAKHEIMALEKGLLEASRMGISNLICYTDLEKMAEILNIRNPTMRAGYVQTNPALERVNILLRRFEKIQFKYIPREQNKRADRLSRQVLLQETDKVSRQVGNSVNIKNLYCIQRYTREQKEKFLDLKKDVRHYLAFNLEARGNSMYIQSYSAYKKNNKYVSSFLGEIKLKKNWEVEALSHITQMLIDAQKSFDLEKDFDNRQIIIAIKEKRETINYLLRGLAPITQNYQKGIDKMQAACLCWHRVVVHYEGVLMDSLFGAPTSNIAISKNIPNLFPQEEVGALNLAPTNAPSAVKPAKRKVSKINSKPKATKTGKAKKII